MLINLKPDSAWRWRFALFPVPIADDRLIWLQWYEWRWVSRPFRFERRATVNGEVITYQDQVTHGLD